MRHQATELPIGTPTRTGSVFAPKC